MDARDIKQEPEEVKGDKYLEKIYELQKQLLDHYIGIEGLPQYPIDVNTKKSQIILKDFTGRVIEELAEGYESLLLVKELTNKNKLWFADYDDKDFIQTINHLQNANEEMADALHFMLELLIYANIQPEDIEAYVNKELNRIYPSSLAIKDSDTITKSMILGKIMLSDNPIIFGVEKEMEKSSLVDLISKYESLDAEDKESTIDTRFIQGGRYFNDLQYASYEIMMWQVAYYLNIARNCLKNKPWKQSQMMTDESKYQEELVKGFLVMMGLFYNMGISVDTLYFLYFKKNMVNQFRIRSNY